MVMPKIFKDNAKNLIYAAALVVLGFVIMAPSINFQHGIAQGDHGRELYIVQETLRGSIPYKDYFWDYGPLMPYVYGASFILFGDGPQSVIMVKNVFFIMGGIFFYLALQLLVSRPVAFAGAIWFFIFNPQFKHTYNHIAAASLFLPLIYFSIKYMIDRKIKDLYWCLPLLFAISLIKLNIGIAMFIGLWLAIANFMLIMGAPWSAGLRRFLLALGLILPVAVIGAYGIFLNGVPLELIKQCFHYAPKYTDFYGISIFDAAFRYFDYIGFFASTNFTRIIFSGICLFSAFRICFWLFQGNDIPGEQKKFISALIALLIFSLLALHEYLLTGIIYKSYWSRPFDYLLIFLCIGTAAKISPKPVKILIIFLCASICIKAYVMDLRKKERLIKETPNQFLIFNQGPFYSTNHPDWFNAVHRTVDYMRKNLSPHETFWAMPYDSLYYYLLERKSPVWELIFVRSQHISENQQRKMVEAIESKKVNYIIMSNRVRSIEPAIGHFGITHGLVLNDYIRKNFKPVAQFGKWESPALYMSNHATKILKRTNPL